MTSKEEKKRERKKNKNTKEIQKLLVYCYKTKFVALLML